MKKILIGLFVVLAVILVTANLFLGNIVRAAAERMGPDVLHVPVKLAKAEFRLLRGHISLKGFALGNPEGYSEGDAIHVGEITIDIDPKSLLRDTIVVKRVYVNAPEINYELALGTSNIGKILDGLSKDEKPGASKEEKPAGKKEGGKKVVIEDLLVENGTVKIAAKVTGGVGAPMPLSPIHMTDIGKEGGGASITDVVGILFRTILTSVTGVVTGAGKLVGEGVGAVGGAAVDGVQAVGGAIGGLFGGDKEKDKGQ